MRHASIVLGALSVALLASTPAWVQQAPVITSTTVELPPGDQLFPGGSDADAINNNCLACHSADMVLNQPALTKSAWESEVNKMIKAYRAPIDENDVPAIVDYLVKIRGKN
jgi:hypothetical protein